ncbi:Serine/threonine-protein kinase PrkC [Novipirellula aureliae]|uniref:non-specific serine/threonine protein kinase n=1 Tax=Novipirellula aureliae TaxID=2527966 RepID=A0A5C6E7Z0_9BACT|nr:serine/threonine-protein kinase [Novipirellula aureliae]TWU45773.1 Serine/threonine-protein kinase PrkC [Novipirellula aureliae]
MRDEHNQLFPLHPSSDTKIRGQGDNETYQSDMRSETGEPPWKEGDKLGSFVLGQFLGKGSSGFVYRAFDQSTQRHCALKLLLPAKYEDLIRNKLGFRRMISLRHPGLMHVDRIYQLDRYTAFSMEEIEGLTFDRWRKSLLRSLREEPSVPLSDRSTDPIEAAYQKLLDLTRQYAAALAVMHSHGLVHRDIKPQNLMVDANGHGRVIDYGLVGTIDLDSDPKGFRDYLVGPRHYFAPETLWDQFYLPASDIFSLGLVVLETLHLLDRESQRDDEEAESSIQRSSANRQADEEKISEFFEDLSSNVPGTLREACQEMLASDPGDRPSAIELARLGSLATPSALWMESSIMGRDDELQICYSWVDSIFEGGAGRLHVEGASGIGKTRLIDEVEHYIKSKRWGQVFRAKCRRGENHPLQAFDQICDAIATRYMRSDREVMEVDPVSTEILHSAFPVLNNVVQASMSVDPAHKDSRRLDALEAGLRLSEQLRIVGPLILIIDDSQWADHDSLNILDRLQTASGGSLGIITISRPDADRQRIPPDVRLTLSELSEDAARLILTNAARRCRLTISEKLIQQIVDAAAGNPFCLIDFSEEFRPGGAFHDALTIAENGDESLSVETGVTPDLSQLWRKRFARLSADAKSVLALIVTAGQAVSMAQLVELAPRESKLDQIVSELAQQRLVQDDATGAECISIIHDGVAEGLLHAMEAESKQACHRAWAEYLSNQNDDDQLAARIAGHFFNADLPHEAVPYAIKAAAIAERYVAQTEAARWYARVIPFMSGPERLEKIRQAAIKFAEADRPAEAAHYFQILASEVEIDESVEHKIAATTLLMRSGHFDVARDQLGGLCRLLGLPVSKPDWLSKLRLLAVASSYKFEKTIQKYSIALRVGEDTRAHKRIDFCLEVARALSMFDNLHAAELNLAGTIYASRYGSESQKIMAEAGEAVFGCYDRGRTRIRSEMSLQQLLPRAIACGDRKVLGDVWAATVHSHSFAMRWKQVQSSLEICMQHYRSQTKPVRFEIAHTRWQESWALWNLGRWSSMLKLSAELEEDAKQRNDLFEWMSFSGGLGASAWLARDQVKECEQIRKENAKTVASNVGIQLFDFAEWLASIHLQVYLGHFDSAWDTFRSMERDLKRLPFSRVQLIRASVSLTGALICLHRLRENARDHAIDQNPIRKTRYYLRKLSREHNPYCDAVSSLYAGLLSALTAQTVSDRTRAKDRFSDAIEISTAEQLRPFQLAAQDALTILEGGESPGLLHERMVRHGIKRPDRFARLYTIELPG